MSSNDPIWIEMKEGNQEAFLTIYSQNYRFLFSYGFSLCLDKELTKDCIQEIFVELWNKRTTVNTEVKNVRSYLFTWLRRKISRAQLRTKKVKDLEEYSSRINYENSYEDLLIAFQEAEEKKEKLRQALKKLTKKQLEIIRLKFFESLSYDAISEKTSLTTRTIYNTIFEAICQLKKFMYIFF